MRKMVDSGVEWIGEMPAQWTVQRAKNSFVQKSERGNSESLVLLSPTQNYGVIPQDLYEQLSRFRAVKLNTETDLSSLKTVHKGAFVISLRSFQGGFEYSEYEGVVSPAYQVFYPSVPVSDHYYKYLFKSQVFIDKMNSFTLSLRDGKNIAFSDFARTYIPIPPLSEQYHIADFLKKKCTQVDTLIANVRAQIEKLKAYKQSVITEVVTKGLDPTVPMKDSGVEWAPHIPDDWAVLPIGRVMYEKKERTKTGTETPLSVTQTQGIILAENANASNPTSSYIDWRCVEPEDIVFNKYKAHSGVFFVSPLAGIVTFNYSVYKCYEGFVPKYFEYQFKTAGCISEFRMSMRGVGESTSPLYTRELFRIFVLCPPKDVQDQIVNYLDNKFAQIDHLIAIKQSKIERLEQYKKSLIYEYVTGKKEIAG